MIEPQFIEKLYSRIVKDSSDIAIGTITLLKPGIVCNLTKHKKDIVLSKLTDKLEEMHTGACFEKLFRTKMIEENNILFHEGLYWEDNAFLLQAIYYSNKIRSSVGFGFDWMSPMGKIDIDFGFPLSNEKYDETEVFRLNFGTSL